MRYDQMRLVMKRPSCHRERKDAAARGGAGMRDEVDQPRGRVHGSRIEGGAEKQRS